MLAEYPSKDCAPETVAEVLEEALWRAGVRHMPMIPGGPIMQFLEVVYARNRIKPVLVRHEVNAVLMAEGYHRASNRIAATLVTAGPGATNTTTGVAVAFREQTPLVCISAQVSTQHRGLDAAQELDTVALLTPITKASVEITDPDEIESTVNDLVALALSAPRGPVHISIPTNLWAQTRPWKKLVPSPQPVRPIVNQNHIDTLIAMLMTARKPIVLAGKGASDAAASELLVRLSNRWGNVMFAATPRAKGVFSETSDRYLGCFGFSGDPEATRAIIDDADLLIVLGSRLGETSSASWSLAKTNARIVQIDINPNELGRNCPIALGVVGDIGDVLRLLMATVEARSTEPPIQGTGADASPTFQSFARSFALVRPTGLDSDRQCVHPIAAVNVIERRVSDDTPIFCDIGNTMSWCIRYLRRRKPRTWHVNLVLGSMGYSVPAAAGAALATQSCALALVGDAAMLMSCMELGTLIDNTLPVVVVVFNNGGHGMVDLGRRKLFPSSSIPDMAFNPAPDFVGLAKSLNVDAQVVTTGAEFDSCLAFALASGRPFLIDLKIDPTAEPPIGARLEALTSQYQATTYTRV